MMILIPIHDNADEFEQAHWLSLLLKNINSTYSHTLPTPFSFASLVVFNGFVTNVGDTDMTKASLEFRRNRIASMEEVYRRKNI